MTFQDWFAKYLSRPHSPRYYRRNGTPYPHGREGFLEWTRDLENIKNWHVARNILSNGIDVSTVWIGANRNYIPYGRPFIFETMLFMPRPKKIIPVFVKTLILDREIIDDGCLYSTEEEALCGHKRLVKKWSQFKSADEVLNDVPKKD